MFGQTTSDVPNKKHVSTKKQTLLLFKENFYVDFKRISNEIYFSKVKIQKYNVENKIIAKTHKRAKK